MLSKTSSITLKNITCDVWDGDDKTLIISFSYSKGPGRKFIRSLEWLDSPGELTQSCDSQMYHSDLYCGESIRMTDEQLAAVRETDLLTDDDINEIRDHLQNHLSQMREE